MIASLGALLVGDRVARAVGSELGASGRDIIDAMSFTSPADIHGSQLSAQGTFFGAAFFGGGTSRTSSVDLQAYVARMTGNPNPNEHHVAAAKMAMVEMLRDKRYENLYDDPGTRTMLQDLTGRLKGNLDQNETTQAFSQFGAAFRGVTGAGDVFAKRVESYRQTLRGLGQPINGSNPIAALSSFSNSQIRNNPSFVQQMQVGQLSAEQRRSYNSFITGLKSRGVSDSAIQFNEATDLIRINQRFNGVSHQFDYAQVRVGTQSLMVPINDASRYQVQGVGSVYHRDRTASSMYSAPGKVMEYERRTTDTPVIREGLDHLFGKQANGELREGAGILDIVSDAYKNNKSLDEVLFSMDGSPAEGAIKLLEFVDQSANPMLSIARKQAQVQVLDPEAPSQMKGLAGFQQYREDLEREGHTLLAINSPGQIASNKFMYTPINPSSPDEVPSFMRMMGLEQSGGQFLTQSDLEKRPIRPGTEPFNIINPGSSRALDRLGRMQDMHVFSQGAYGEMQKNGMGAFVRGTWYHNKKGKARYSQVVPLKDASDSAGFTLDVRLPSSLKAADLDTMSPEQLEQTFSQVKMRDNPELGTFQGKSSIVEIAKGRNSPASASGFEAYEYNSKLDQAFNQLERLSAGGAPLDIEERKRAIQGLGINFEEGEFLGYNNVLENIEKQNVAVPGQGAISLVDMMPTANGYKAVFNRQGTLGEGAKIEGSTVSTVSRNVVTGDMSRGKLHGKMNDKLIEMLSAKDFDASSFYRPEKATLNPDGTPSAHAWENLSGKDKLKEFKKAQERTKRGTQLPVGTPTQSASDVSDLPLFNYQNRPEVSNTELMHQFTAKSWIDRVSEVGNGSEGAALGTVPKDVLRSLEHMGYQIPEPERAAVPQADGSVAPAYHSQAQVKKMYEDAKHLAGRDLQGELAAAPEPSFKLPEMGSTPKDINEFVNVHQMAKGSANPDKNAQALLDSPQYLQYHANNTREIESEILKISQQPPVVPITAPAPAAATPASTSSPSPNQKELDRFATQAEAETVTNLQASAHREVLRDLLGDKNKFLEEMAGRDISMLADDIDFVAENKRLGGGNIKELRTQQQTAIAKFSELMGTGLKLGDINNYDMTGVDTGEFEAAAKTTFTGLNRQASYTAGDTQQLARYLKASEQEFSGLDEQTRRFALGSIFGLEGDVSDTGATQSVLNTMLVDHRDAIKSLGISDTFLTDLEEGIKQSEGVFGLSWHTVRDVADTTYTTDASMERRFYDHLFFSTETDPAFRPHGQRILNTIKNRIQSSDPGHVEALSIMVNAQRTGAKQTDRLLDLGNIVDDTEARQTLAAIRTEGGFIRHKGTDFFVPDASTLQRAVTVDGRNGRRIEDLKLHGIVSQMLDSASTEIDRKTGDFSAFEVNAKALVDTTFDLTKVAFNARLENKLRGTVYGQIRQSTNETIRNAKHGYTVGMSKDAIQKHFDELNRGVGKEEAAFLKDMQEQVLAGNKKYAVYGWQNPQIGPESMSVFEAYYDKNLDEVGGFTVGSSANMTKRGKDNFLHRVGGFLTGKTSSDYDGDKAFFMVIGAKSGKNATQAEVANKYANQEQELLSGTAMRNQFHRQRAWFGGGAGSATRTQTRGAFDYEARIKSSLNQLSAQPSMHGPITDDILARHNLLDVAYQKGHGQAEIGLMSNRILDLHNMNYSMRQSGGIDLDTSKQVTKFLSALEQEAVGFKHASFSAASYLENKVGAILEQGSSLNESVDMFTELLTDLGFDNVNTAGRVDMSIGRQATGSGMSRIAHSLLQGSNRSNALVGMGMVREGYAAIAASKKSESATAMSFIESVGNGYRNLLSVLHAADPAMSGLVTNAALNTVVDPNQRTSLGNDAAARIAANNAAEMEKAAGRSGGKTLSSAAEDVVRSLAEDATHKRATAFNKIARPAGIAAIAMAGAYALFNKGYDDTPLTDIPAPPPGRSIMGMSSADMESVRSGSLLNDHYAKEGIATAGANSGGYEESNIPAPNSIIKKSYLNGSTARINNRSLTLDRTSPLEYGRAVQSTIPGSQVGLNINHNYNVPSDLHRQL